MNLKRNHLPALSDVLRRNAQTLEDFNIGFNNDLQDADLQDIADDALILHQLKKLTMSWIGLSSRSGSTLASIISHCPALTYIDLSGNQIKDSGFADISPVLQLCKHLQKLNLQYIGLTGESSSMTALASICTVLSSSSQHTGNWREQNWRRRISASRSSAATLHTAMLSLAVPVWLDQIRSQHAIAERSASVSTSAGEVLHS